MNRSERTPAERWVPWISLAAIALLTFVGLAQIGLLDSGPRFSPQISAIIVAVLIVVGFLEIVVVRWFVLPRASEWSDELRESRVGSSYMFAVAPSVFGLVVSLFTGKGLLTLPFTALALAGLVVVWTSLKDTVDSAT